MADSITVCCYVTQCWLVFFTVVIVMFFVNQLLGLLWI